MINFSDKNNKTAFIATGIIHLVVLLILVFSYIHYNFVPLPDNNDKNDITFFGGEYVMLGDVPNSAVDAHESAPEPVKTAEKLVTNDLDTKNSGSAGEEAAPKISTEKESPMKVEKKKVPEKSGPTKEELEAARNWSHEVRERIQIRRRMEGWKALWKGNLHLREDSASVDVEELPQSGEHLIELKV